MRTCALLIPGVLIGVSALAQEADLVVRNARIWTGLPDKPWANAITVRQGRIAALDAGDTAATKVIDAGGRMITPGFIDSHVHFLEGGSRLTAVQLRDAASKQEFIRRIAAFAKTVPEGAWIVGGDWNHELWGGELPAKNWIDAATPKHPVWVKRLDGHMGLANSLALKMSGVGRTTKDIEGGAIVRNAAGEPEGVLKDNAASLIERTIPPPAPTQKDKALAAAMRYVASHGVTSIHHMGTWEDLEVFQRAAKSGDLSTRIYAAVPLSTWERLRDYTSTHGRGDAWLRWGMLKGFVDGSLGSHTAAMQDPFTDAPGDRGFLVTPELKLEEWIRGADRAGLHVAVHAIGDRANRTLLDIYGRVIEQNGPRDRRFRIEHAQHLRKEDIARFAELQVIASMQPYHAIDDGCWAEKVIGPERAKGTYAFRSLSDSKARLAFGSDWFVAPPSVAEGIYAAVTRATLDDRHPGGWVPEQKIGWEDALRAYTYGGAYAAFETDRKGTLAPGMLADFVMLDGDPSKLASHQLRSLRVTLTVVGGRVVYQRP
ncbi:MAG: amidohydrolase [Acidobacteriia bacterium]|nr:amidohydrolase [Terriglobia bacterium]